MKIVSLAVSKAKGTTKTQVQSAQLVVNHGLENDAHAGTWHRQISFLSSESIDKANSQGLDVGFGDFAENIATDGIDWPAVPVGTVVKLGADAEVEITQIGKTCHRKCAIYYKAGDCIMPREGVFGKVLKGGRVNVGDAVSICGNQDLAGK